jgi:hypothetical protein
MPAAQRCILVSGRSAPPPSYVATLELPIVTMGATDPHTGAMAMPVVGPGDKLICSMIQCANQADTMHGALGGRLCQR